ncbi:YveK family protein [Paenilisteria newyorkensis]|uniref:YveK family protein n=1 Tax=Listeria newyorkensis TaxID=1497681 RepID=UPI000669FDEB|nr:Wzz/FepE/Etk N-terminal domain-containing protein [Listeria newyorkensis]KMT62112.1 putative capsular polysaccharide biosynthesis protein [Listeria newyorkensis]
MNIEKKIDMKMLVQYLKRYAILLLFMTNLGIAGAYVWVTQMAVPMYQASSDILVKPQKLAEDDIRLDANTNNRLISTYTGILKSNYIIDKVKGDLNLVAKPEILAQKLAVKNENDSQIISVSYKADSAEKAMEFVNKTVSTMQQEVGNLIEDNTIVILSKAVEGTVVSPNKKVSLVMGAFIGLMIGSVIMFIHGFTNVTIREEADIQEVTVIPVLGEIEKW